MKTKTIFLLLTIALLCLAGCQSSANKTGTSGDNPIAGTWVSQGPKPWKLILENDGTISEVFRPDGLHMVVAEGGIKKELEPNILAIYTFGPCTWSYDASSNYLKAVVEIEDLYFTTGSISVSSTIKDVFEGQLQNDNSTWAVTWSSLEKIHKPEKEESRKKKVMFKKVEDTQSLNSLNN